MIDSVDGSAGVITVGSPGLIGSVDGIGGFGGTSVRGSLIGAASMIGGTSSFLDRVKRKIAPPTIRTKRTRPKTMAMIVNEFPEGPDPTSFGGRTVIVFEVVTHAPLESVTFKVIK